MCGVARASTVVFLNNRPSTARRSLPSAGCDGQQTGAALYAGLRAIECAHLLLVNGEYSITDVTEMFSVGRATVYRVLDRAGCGRAGEAA
jgi:hypothetical protein